jgi:hypothetical protein
MKKFKRLETGNIDLEVLLSSRTYYNFGGFNRCVYCNEEIESSDWITFTDKQGNKHWVAPTRCNCKNAKRELEAKLKLLNELGILDENIDSQKINEELLKEDIKKIKDEYEHLED